MMIPKIYWCKITCYFGLSFTRNNANFEHSYEEFQIDVPKSVEHVEDIIEHFQKRWWAEYVTSLREYQKLHKPKTQAVLSKNDLVLAFDDKQPRQKWLLGKITELIPSNDGQIQGAKGFLGKTWNIIDRLGSRLYTLETNFQFVLKGSKQDSVQEDEANTRPKQNAADLAKLRIKYAWSINCRGGSVKFFRQVLKVKYKSHVFL